jgi:flavorubredoxin
MLPNIAAFLELVKGFKPRGRQISFFGSYGWAGGSVNEMQEMLKNCGGEFTLPGIAFKYNPDPVELESCVEFGRNFALSLLK